MVVSVGVGGSSRGTRVGCSPVSTFISTVSLGSRNPQGLGGADELLAGLLALGPLWRHRRPHSASPQGHHMAARHFLNHTLSAPQVSRSACLMTTQLICKLLRSREAAAAVDVRAWPPILDTGQSSSPPRTFLCSSAFPLGLPC